MLKEASQHAIQLFPLLSRQNHVTSQFLASSCIFVLPAIVSQPAEFRTSPIVLCNVLKRTGKRPAIYSATRRDAVMFFFLTCGMLVIYEACFVLKAFCRYALAMGSTLCFCFPAINIFYHHLPMPRMIQQLSNCDICVVDLCFSCAC